MSDQQNVVLAIALSIAVIIGFEFFYMAPLREQAAQQAALQQTAQQQVMTPTAPAAEDAPALPGSLVETPAEAAMSRAEALAATPRIEVESPRLHGSISLAGGRIDDIVLVGYHETTEPSSPEITLLSPRGAKGAYFAEFGWIGPEESIPGPGTIWRADGDRLTPERPVTLRWESTDGLVFSRRIALDADYMFTVTQRVENRGDTPVELIPYSRINRTDTPVTLGFYILHEGPLGVFGGTLTEIDYGDLQESDSGQEKFETTGGWIGITDKYWLVALAPDQAAPFSGRFIHALRGETDQYQADALRATMAVPAGGAIEITDRVFVGAKIVHLLDRYRDELGIVNFDLSVDFGWFYFLTKPIFFAIDYFNGWLGNFGLAILLLTVLIKLAFFPLANKSYKAMSKMKKLQPKMAELKETYGDDKQRMQQELMRLYKEEKVNPAAGCLPILVQIPVFFALYKVLFVTIEMRHAPFYGWIRDLSAPDPTSLFNLFGLIPWTPYEILLIGVWPLLMGLTMWLQQKLNPQPPDPTQAKIMMMLPIVFTFILARFPAGLVIYWTWNNILSIAQQWAIMKRMGVKV